MSSSQVQHTKLAVNFNQFPLSHTEAVKTHLGETSSPVNMSQCFIQIMEQNKQLLCADSSNSGALNQCKLLFVLTGGQDCRDYYSFPKLSLMQ